ncbi:VWA domain-containing protein [Desulfotomaculum copahuensis]|uniref:VWA containing CoxE family protein n=1 Tax=Desulfotomaculum copahuensis TaxID=1838280 RepID=A0A1B7LH56_9FIRM|nr:VWA domain-containing protein [Desulfotomaculum copahuensis]OAT85531.1 hypothetical protein A6M21_06375 [Desulfotomaculum copahuensis]
MIKDLTSFVRLLRRAGLPVSPGELLDLCRALELLTPSRENMLLAMQATLVKEAGRQATLEKLFDYYFSAPDRGGMEAVNQPAGGMPGEPAPLSGPRRYTNTPCPPRGQGMPSAAGIPPVDRRPRLSGDEFNARLAGMKDWLRRETARPPLPGAGNCAGGPGRGGGAGAGRTGASRGRANPAAEERGSCAWLAQGLPAMLQRGEPDEMAALAGEALKFLNTAESGEENLAAALCRVKVHLNWAQVEDMLARGTGMREAQQLRGRENLARLEALLRRQLEKEWLHRHGSALEAVAERENLSALDFARLDNSRLNEMRRLLVRLGRRLATRPGYRRAPSRRGPVDMRRTVRLAVATAGVPLILYCQKRLPQRPELIVLCDFSGSVAPYSRFMLLLIYAMQHKFRPVRTFAFVDAVAEITAHLKEPDQDRAVRNIIRRTGIWQTGFSDYGAVWEQFLRFYAGAVNNKTTLLVLGDARNNYKPPGTENFREICRRARRVIWLNPAPEEKWEREDSVLSLYAPYCRRVYPCRNLAQLTRIARDAF